jgi:MSHA biogenesis protein MshN
MSVIHSVLTKLDARGAPPPAALGAMPPLASAGNGASRRLMVTAALGIGALGFVALADWPKWLRSAHAAQAATTSAPTVAESTTAVEHTARSSGDAVAAPPATTAPDTTAAVVTPTPVPAAAQPSTPSNIAATATPRRVAVATVARERTTVTAIAPAAPDAVATPIDKRNVAPNAPQRALLLLRQANEAAQAGQPRAALAQARDALALDPALTAARLLAAVLEHETGASERAAQLLRDGLARDPRDSAQAMLLARVLIAQGDAPGALAALERHAVRGAEADGLRGGILTQQGDYSAALGAYESAARQQPANSMWWLGLGVALDSEGQPQRARQAYAHALSLGLPRDDLTQFADRRLRATD